MPKAPVNKGGRPRISNASTPIPGEPEGLTLADRLSFADAPRPFRNPAFVSRLNVRTATSSTAAVKKNAKQLLTLERERYAGGDGFLSAAQTQAKARGEAIEIPGKKKKAAGAAGGLGLNVPRPKGWNLKNRGSNKSGAATPSTAVSAGGTGGSGVSTPMLVDEEAEDEDEDGAAAAGAPAPEAAAEESSLPKKEIITYHTPTAPPSLLPAKKYCDITGLHAAYTDPRTKLRYKGLEVWNVVRNLGPGGDQAYLALRNAQTALK